MPVLAPLACVCCAVVELYQARTRSVSVRAGHLVMLLAMAATALWIHDGTVAASAIAALLVTAMLLAAAGRARATRVCAFDLAVAGALLWFMEANHGPYGQLPFLAAAALTLAWAVLRLPAHRYAAAGMMAAMLAMVYAGA